MAWIGAEPVSYAAFVLTAEGSGVLSVRLICCYFHRQVTWGTAGATGHSCQPPLLRPPLSHQLTPLSHPDNMTSRPVGWPAALLLGCLLAASTRPAPVAAQQAASRADATPGFVSDAQALSDLEASYFQFNSYLYLYTFSL